MNSNEKRWIVLLIAVVLIAVVLIVVLVNGNKDKSDNTLQDGTQQGEVVNEEKYTTELDDGTKINTGEEFNKTKTYGNLEISNIQYTEKDGKTTLLADVKNNGTTKHEAEIVKIEILDENGNVITDGKPVIGDIEPGATIKLNASFSADVANAKDFRITAVK